MKKFMRPALYVKNRGRFHQTLIVMKLTAFLITFICAQACATGHAQNITLSVKNGTMEKVLNQIKKQRGYIIFYESNLFPASSKLDITLQNVPLANALKQLFKNLPLTYDIVDNTIVINRKDNAESINAAVHQSLNISGRVTDERGESLPGVTVAVKETQKVTVTNSEGYYRIAAQKGQTLVFTFIGFKSRQVVIADETTINITFKQELNRLTEVQVIGYGTQNRQDITSAIASIKPDNIDKGTTNDPLKFLQGRATGVNVLTPGGTPGTKPIILVRGVGSISGGSSPLYVIDGVPTEYTPNLNPDDIESIEALKDASASAIYGSRANSGVILITTKSGREGKTEINFSSHTGAGTIYNDIPMANSAQYTAVMQDAIKNYNAQKGTSLSLYVPPVINETNWVKEISRKSAVNTITDINLSGGNKSTTLFTSFGYYGQQGILKNSNYNQYNYRLNINHIINPYFTLHSNLSGSYTDQRLLEETSTSLKPLYSAREEQPWYGPYNADGTYAVNGINGIIRHNPVMMDNEEIWKQNTTEGIGRISLDITPVKGLTYTPSISAYGSLLNNNKKLTDQMAARAQTAGWGALLQDRNIALRYVFDNLLDYKHSIGKASFDLLAGHSFEKYTNDQLGLYSSNYANGAYPSSNLNVVNAGTNIYPDNTSLGFDAYDLESYFGRVTLDYDNRYILNASLRSDGSSKFSENARYGTFPAASIGWIVTNESFWQQTAAAKVLTHLKLRASYGITGSLAGIGSYANQSLVAGGNSYNNQGGLVVSHYAQNLTWEKAAQTDIGFDAEFFNGVIAFTTDYFYQKTTNLLFNKPVYATTGFNTVAANIGSLQNKGLELGLNAKILRGAFKWDAAANITFINNKLLSLYDGSSQYILPASGSSLLGGGIGVHALIDGEPISAFYMLKQTGIYQYDNEVPAKLFAKGVRAGDIQYQDVNNDGDISAADRQYVGKAIPDYYGGFNTSISYKGFDLGLFAQYALGGKVFASWKGASPEGIESLGNAFSTATLTDGTKNTQFYNVDQYAATHYWTGPGTSNFMPRAVMGGVFTGYANGYNEEPSTHFLEDGSYLRLKTLTLGYSLPPQFLHKYTIASLRLFASVDNLYTFTKYDGYDPEQSFVNNPGDPNYGVDFGLQSTLRTISLGIKLKF